MYKSFGTYLFEASVAAEERKKEKDMVDKFKTAKKASIDADSALNKIEKDKDAENVDVTKAKLIATKADAAQTQISADIKLKSIDKSEKKK